MMTVNRSTTGDVFLAFIRQLLVPTLRLGDIVIMDNLSAHRVAGVREASEAVAAFAKRLNVPSLKRLKAPIASDGLARNLCPTRS